jgi:O-antigen ligase
VAPTAAVAAAALVGVSAALGGAFGPGPRTVVGVLITALAMAVPLVVSRLRPAELGLLVFLAWGAAVGVIRGTAPLAAKETVAVWLVAWLLWVIGSRAGADAGRQVVVILIGTACVVTLGIGLEVAGRGLSRASGLFVNPNDPASLLVPTLVAAWAFRGRRVWLPLLLVLLLGSGIALTGSRAAVLALGAGLLVMLPTRQSRIIGAVVVVGAVASVLVWRTLAVADSLAWHRIGIWSAVLDLVATQPVTGVGPGSLPEAAGVVRITHADAFAQHLHSIGAAESTALGVLVQTGAVGLVVVLVSAALWLVSIWRAGALSCPARRAVLVSLLVISVVHDELRVDIVLWWWALLLGVLFPVGAERVRSTRARMVVAFSLAGLMLWGVVQPASARWWWGRHPTEAEAALRMEPWLSEAARALTRGVMQRRQWTWHDAAEASHWSHRAVVLRPGQAALWADRARVQARVARELGGPAVGSSVQQAREAYARACALEPRLPWYWAELALLERDLGELERARAAILRALDAEPRFVRAWLLLARTEVDLGRIDAARDALEAAAAAEDAARGLLLSGYERELVRSSPWQWDQLREVIR